MNRSLIRLNRRNITHERYGKEKPKIHNITPLNTDCFVDENLNINELWTVEEQTQLHVLIVAVYVPHAKHTR